MRKKSKRDCIADLIRDNPIITQSEIRPKLKDLGYDKVSSSEVSDARRKLGLIAPLKLRPMTIDDVHSISDLPAVLGITIKETIEICEILQKRSVAMGGIGKVIEALRVLNKFTSVN